MNQDKYNGLKIGDKVRYSSEFLRNIVDLSHASAIKFGYVEGFEDFGRDDFVIAKLNKSNLPLNVNVKCLEVIK